MDRDRLRQTYDERAEDYALMFSDELDRKPADRELLDRIATRLDGRGRVIEVGCGPGQIARYLHDRGVEISGVDLSPAMVEVATRQNPGIDFEVGDMAHLRAADDSLAGIVAFYSLIHIPPPEVPAVLGEFARALAPAGLVALAAHEGEGEMATDAYFFTADELVSLLETAGFAIDLATTRDPYPSEGSTRRIYLIAERLV